MSPTELVHTIFYTHQTSGVCKTRVRTIAGINLRGLGQNDGNMIARIKRYKF